MGGGSRRRPRPKLLARKLKEVRLHRGLSQPEFAKLFKGIPSAPDGAMVSRFERDLREPSLFVILRYAEIAKVSVNVLIDDRFKVAQLKTYMPVDTTRKGGDSK